MVPPAVDVAALIADLQSASSEVKKGPACSVQLAVAELPAEAQGIIEQLIDRPDIFATNVCRVLDQHGLRVAPPALRRHRLRGTSAGCKCPRPAPPAQGSGA